MANPLIDLIQHLIFSLRSGNSTVFAVKAFQTSKPKLWQKLELSRPDRSQISITSIEYELKFILERGEQGLPVLKSLIALNTRALDKLSIQIDQHSAKTPFLALIPLFALQVPSLILIFIFPLTNELLESFQ